MARLIDTGRWQLQEQACVRIEKWERPASCVMSYEWHFGGGDVSRHYMNKKSQRITCIFIHRTNSRSCDILDTTKNKLIKSDEPSSHLTKSVVIYFLNCGHRKYDNPRPATVQAYLPEQGEDTRYDTSTVPGTSTMWWSHGISIGTDIINKLGLGHNTKFSGHLVQVLGRLFIRKWRFRLLIPTVSKTWQNRKWQNPFYLWLWNLE